jgi:hypothetical protein
MYRSKRGDKVGARGGGGIRNTICIDCSGVYVYSGGAAPPDYIEASQRHWQAAGNSGMHDYIRMQLSALAPSLLRPGHAGRHLISSLFGGGVCYATMCGSHGAPAGCS